MSSRTLHLDFETRSTVDLKRAGVYIYAGHVSTDIWCMAYAFDDGPVRVWRLGEKLPNDVAAHILCGEPVMAHNAGFEWSLWNGCAVPKYGWPALDIEQCFCTAAMAAAMSLPRDLAGAGAAVGLTTEKDMTGHRLMMQMCRPRKGPDTNCPICRGSGVHPGTAISRPGPCNCIVWWDDPAKLERLIAYCKTDVEVERLLEKRVLPLSPQERKIWLLDHKINTRGVALDMALVSKAQIIVDEAQGPIGKELRELTNGAVTAGTQVQKIMQWLKTRFVDTPSIDKEHLLDLLEQDLPDDVERVLRLRQESAKASTAKLSAMQSAVSSDGRVRSMFLYHGASTGRWCLTGDHEVLTPSGWKRMDRWAGGSIACWSKEETVTFQKADAVSFPFCGDLVHHASKRIDQIATPEHKMPCWSAHHGGFQIKTAGTLGRVCIPYTGTRSNGVFVDENALRAMVMVQADGHYTPGGLLRLKFRKDRKVQRCKTLLRRAQITFTARVNGDCTTTVDIARRHLPLYLKMFADKTFGWWLLECDHAVLFDELEKWDAYRSGPNSIQYVTTNKQNADVVQACAHLSGRAASVSIKKDRLEHWSEAYYVAVWLAPSNRHEVRSKPQSVAHHGPVFCAVTPTGFFLVRRNGKVWVTGNSGARVQLHNMPRPDMSFEEIEEAIPHIHAGEGDLLRLLYGSPINVVSNCLRSMLVAAPGKELVTADFSNIEGRTLAWLAGQNDLVEFFRSEGPVYERMGAAIYGLTTEEVLAKGKSCIEREIGKRAVLGCGYGMGADKFKATCKKEGNLRIEKSLAEKAVKAWREQNDRIVAYWKALESAAIQAVKNPGSLTEARLIKFKKSGSFLFGRLPSGRAIAYPYPTIYMQVWVKYRNGKKGTMPLAEARQRDDIVIEGDPFPGLRYKGVDNYTRRWGEIRTYGGMLAENFASGTARDVLAEALVRVEEAGYPVVIHVHDEAGSEVEAGRADVAEYERLMAVPPAWAPGLPIKAEGWKGVRYRK